MQCGLKHRKSLCAMASQSGGDECTHPSSHTPYAVLTTPERRMFTMLRLDSLCKKLNEECAKSNVTVDETLNSDIRILALEGRGALVENYPKDSSQQVFWEQEKATSLKDSHSMKHPLFIKWCLYLHHLSEKAYKMMHKLKCIYLPTGKSLCVEHLCIIRACYFIDSQQRGACV